jgi:hypothetical protein
LPHVKTQELFRKNHMNKNVIKSRFLRREEMKRGGKKGEEE